MTGVTEVRRAPAGGSVVAARVGTIALELAVLGAVWWITGLKWPLVAAVAAVIVVWNAVPERVQTLTMGVMLLALAGFVYGVYRAQQLALVLALFGALGVGAGALALRRGR